MSLLSILKASAAAERAPGYDAFIDTLVEIMADLCSEDPEVMHRVGVALQARSAADVAASIDPEEAYYAPGGGFDDDHADSGFVLEEADDEDEFPVNLTLSPKIIKQINADDAAYANSLRESQVATKHDYAPMARLYTR